jgi:lambda family phage tail tape measure protein
MADSTARIVIGAKDETSQAFTAVDRAIQKLQISANTLGKSASEAKLFELALKGASAEQLKSADAALKAAGKYQKGVDIANQLKTSLFTLGAAAGVGLIAAGVAFDKLISKAADFQDAAEKTGDTASNIASLSVAAATGGLSMENLVAASVKLTKNLTGVDDESKAAGAAIASLGLNIEDFKNLKPADQFETLGKALNGFADGPAKTAVVIAAMGRGAAEVLPFLKELGAEGGRQKVLTEEQIRLADEYKDKQAKSREQLVLYASAIATQALPALTGFTDTLVDFGKEIIDIDGKTTTLGKNSSIATFAQNSALALAGLIDNVRNVADGFVLVGQTIGGSIAAIAAASRGEFASVAAINKEMLKDREKLFNNDFQGRLAAKFAEAAPSAKFTDPRLLGDPGTIAQQAAAARPKLSFNGGVKADRADKAGGKDTAAAEAKAQLAFDVDAIKKAGDALIANYVNAEKIIEAERSAALLDERTYYASKLAFINLNADAQKGALNAELARLQAEKLSGKDKIDNDRKILEVQAKLATVREAAIASVEILKIQETTALNKIAQSYREADDAATDYLTTLQRTQRASLGGFGIGNFERDRRAGTAQINDKFEGDTLRNERFKRDGLASGTFGADAQTKYEQELRRIASFRAAALAEFEDYFGKRTALESSAGLGAQEALKNYQADVANTYKSTEAIVTSAFKGMEDALVSFAKTGKLDFKSLADSIISDLIRIQAKSLVGDLGGSLGWLGGLLGGSGIMGGGGTVDFDASFFSSLFKFADGGDPPVGVPSIVGERGKELFIPRQPGTIISNEQLRASFGGSSSGGESITIVNQTTGRIDNVVSQEISPGQRAIFLQENQEAMAQALYDPNSKVSRAMQQNFNAQRQRA